MQEPRDSHWNAAKRVLRYIQGTKDFGIIYKKTKNFVLGGFSDANFAGYLMNMLTAANPDGGLAAVSWSCKKQATVAISLVEVEYISAWEVAGEIVWLRRVL